MEQRKKLKERKSTDLTDNELAMLRSTTKLTNKELKAWHTEFLRLYPAGKFDRDCYIKTCEHFLPQENTRRASDVFDWLDKNSDGTVDFNEFLFSFAVNSQVGNSDERLQLIFDVWDISEDGQLDQNELAHLISAMYDRARIKHRQGEQNPQTRAKTIITKLDLNSDSKLSRHEFVIGCKNDEVIAQLLAPNQ